MSTETAVDFEKWPGHRWYENGQSALGGPLFNLFQRLDRLFLSWAAECQAREYLFPPFIPARALAKLDYFRSFPHLVTFPVTLDSSEANLKRFAEGKPIDSNGEIHLTAASPIRDVITPAACYHFYHLFQGERFEQPAYLTTRAHCFRRETHYLPLQRQWSFSMREIVCIGTAEEVKGFLGQYQERVSRFFEKVGLPIDWKEASDPFFNPSQNPKYLLQKLAPVKKEMVFEERLAIGSVNFHRNYFGEAFEIQREGREAFSGCVAFGLERWIYTLLTHFGPNESDWPALESE
ncbi:MAG: aminoacyl--tRNA ligase-related protein [Candidatus Manganitrophaceae bacterium]